MRSGQGVNSTVDIAKTSLPMRVEKQIVPFISDASSDQNVYFNILESIKAYYDHVIIRLPGRGRDSLGNPSPTGSALYRFLINPAQINISKQTVDSQTLTKGGWQIGVWGQDFTSISLTGKTPGRYFTRGLTDRFAEYTASYRSLADLEMVVENNGCWFEGEQLNESALAASDLRSRIKMHGDVELTVGEFVWSGMFDELTVSEDATTPFLSDFSITFVAWKQRYRAVTPYRNAIRNDVQRGHTASPLAIQASTSLASNNPMTIAGSTDLTVPVNEIPINDIMNPSTGTLLP